MRLILASLAIVCVPAAARAQSALDLVNAARAALKQGKAEEALKLADKAAELAPKSPAVQLVRATAFETMGKNAEAANAYGQAIALDPKLAAAYNARGAVHFKLGQFKESLQDFDKFLELQPDKKEDHWQRGISLYYAGRYAEGRDQFKLGDKVFANDVENAFWHYLCNARATSVEKARAELLKVGTDKRVPLMAVYALIAGKAKPEAVLAAIETDNPAEKELNARRFYGHLYLGLYFEAAGDKPKALEHLRRAAEDYKVNHYMWDVARVHRDLLNKK